MGKEKNTIYHYCSVETFLNIIKSKTIRLSDSRKTNDYLENEYIYELLKEMKKKDLELNKVEDIEKIGQKIDSNKKYYPYIACFSKKGDLLSQWRAYANDGKGLSIGFNKDYFDKLASLLYTERQIEESYKELLKYAKIIGEKADKIEVNKQYKEYIEDLSKIDWESFIKKYVEEENYEFYIKFVKDDEEASGLVKYEFEKVKNLFENRYNQDISEWEAPFLIKNVVYNIDEQKKIIKNIIAPKKKMPKSSILTDVFDRVYDLWKYSYCMKKNGFEEECEIRFIHLAFIMEMEKNFFYHKNEYFNLSFTNTSDDIKSFLELNFSKKILDEYDGEIYPINEIYLGPKCNIDRETLSLFLNEYEIRPYKYFEEEKIKILKSDLSYR